MDIDLVILDGDGTLWHCLGDDSVSLSDDGPGPGRPNFTFQRAEYLDHCIVRDDGQQFVLFESTLWALEQLRQSDIRVSLASFNYPEPVFHALDAWNIRPYFTFPTVAWTERKDLMLELILASFEGHRKSRAKRDPQALLEPSIERSRTILIDNSEDYAEDADRVRIGFRHIKSGKDIATLIGWLVS